MMMRPFVDRPITDLAAADTLATSAAAKWGLASPVLMRAGMNAIYRCADTVLRVSSPSAPASTSLALAATLTAAGLAVPQPARAMALVDGELSVTAWEHVAASDQPIDWIAVGGMVRRVHTLVRSDIPVGYPSPRPSDFSWWNFDVLLDDVASVIDPSARRGILDAIGRWPDWASTEGEVVCHGDVHPGNVIMTNDGPVLIDWDLLCLAPPGWDHAPMMTWHSRWGGDASWYSDFSIGYGASMYGDPAAEGFAELRLVAATLMRLKAAMRDPAAMPEAERRLAYWRGDSDATMWQAQ